MAVDSGGADIGEQSQASRGAGSVDLARGPTIASSVARLASPVTQAGGHQGSPVREEDACPRLQFCINSHAMLAYQHGRRLKEARYVSAQGPRRVSVTMTQRASRGSKHSLFSHFVARISTLTSRSLSIAR